MQFTQVSLASISDLVPHFSKSGCDVRDLYHCPDQRLRGCSSLFDGFVEKTSDLTQQGALVHSKAQRTDPRSSLVMETKAQQSNKFSCGHHEC